MMYTAQYMASLRTQIYLTREQRERLDEVRRREGKPLAQVVREAIDAYLGSHSDEDVERAMHQTFGIDPSFSVPSRSEWDRRRHG